MKYVLNGVSVTREEFMAGAPGITPGQPPCIMTDDVFLAGNVNGSQFEGQEATGNLYKRLALKAGVNPKGKVYKKGLARYPGDPRAWVSGRGDVQRRLEELGWSSEGAVTVKGRQAEPDEIAIAEDIVADDAQAIADARGGVVDEGLKEQVREKRRASWTRKRAPKKKAA